LWNKPAPKKTAVRNRRAPQLKKKLPHGKSIDEYSDGEYIGMGERMDVYNTTIDAIV
jgi:hypothetical protein